MRFVLLLMARAVSPFHLVSFCLGWNIPRILVFWQQGRKQSLNIICIFITLNLHWKEHLQNSWKSYEWKSYGLKDTLSCFDSWLYQCRGGKSKGKDCVKRFFYFRSLVQASRILVCRFSSRLPCSVCWQSRRWEPLICGGHTKSGIPHLVRTNSGIPQLVCNKPVLYIKLYALGST